MLTKLRNNLTYANGTSTLCLFIVLGGSSYAAVTLKRNSVKGKHIAASAVTSPKVKDRSLRARDFKLGELPAGPQGGQGAAGRDGSNGVVGSAAASTLTGRTDGGSSTRYSAPSGTSASSPSEFDVVHLSPNATIVARDLSVKTQTSTGPAGGTATFTLMDDESPTPVSCTVSLAFPMGNVNCNSGGATATISPGSELSLRMTIAGESPLTQFVRFAWRATTP